jgi:hypothetical protein
MIGGRLYGALTCSSAVTNVAPQPTQYEWPLAHVACQPVARNETLSQGRCDAT